MFHTRSSNALEEHAKEAKEYEMSLFMCEILTLTVAVYKNASVNEHCFYCHDVKQ